MRNKHTTRRVWRTFALLLCLCLLCLPLMGMAAQGEDGGTGGGEPEIVYIDIVPEETEAATLLGYRPGHGGGGKPTDPCDPEPTPAPVCNCETKCADDAPNTTCPVCSVGVEGCTGQEPTPAPVCNCETKCADDTPNTDCPVCAVSVEGCTGQEPTPAPVCNCETKCAADTPNTACPVCSVGVEGCTGQEPTPAPVCNCETNCAADAPNTACPVCAASAAECQGKPVAPDFTIRILRPSGWYTDKADVEIRLSDVNKTGWAKVEVKIEKNGSWTDLTDDFLDTDRTTLEISENCTVYVTVTDKEGKAHTKSAYIECFDREAPTVRAGIDGALLRVEASDTLSGVEYIYINGYRFTNLTNGTLDVRLKEYADEYEQMTVVAVDYAGNRSKTVQVKNPYYGEDEDGATVKPTPTPTPTPTTPAPTPSTGSTGNTGNSGGGNTSKPTASPTPTASAEEITIEPVTGFTQNGNAIVRDLLYDKHTNKQFIAVETKDGNIFYVVIDYDKPVDEDANLYETYFLNLVDNADLTALLEDGNAAPSACSCTEKCGAGAVNTACPLCATNMAECAGKEAEPEPDATPDLAADTEPVEKDEGGGSGMLILAVIAILAAGGAGYYFKVYRPKHLAADDGDEYEDGGPDDDALWDDGADEDDGPPWDEDEGDAGEVEDEE